MRGKFERLDEGQRKGLDAHQNLFLDIVASFQDYEREVAAERAAAGQPELGAAEFLAFVGEHLRSQFLESSQLHRSGLEGGTRP